MERGITGLMRTAARFYLSGSKGRTFMSGILPEIHKSAKIRERHEQAGTHVPPFLIASIASQCNLRCSGCYARATGGCSDSAATGDLSDAEWKVIFTEAIRARRILYPAGGGRAAYQTRCDPHSVRLFQYCFPGLHKRNDGDGGNHPPF